jgi:N-acetylglucosamine-6-phosphate deacetylase
MEAIVDSDVYCELICDGVHVHPSFVRVLRQLAGRDRVVLVTDAAWCAGLPDGEYRTPQRHLEVRHGAVTLWGTGILAGSTLTMANAARQYARFTGAGGCRARRCRLHQCRPTVGRRRPARPDPAWSLR